MAQATSVLDKTYQAAGDLRTKIFHAAVLSAEYTANAAGANVHTIGIIQNEPDRAGGECRVRHLGSSKATAGAAFAANAKLTTNAAGRLIAATAGQNVTAIALQAATADGDIVEVLVTPGATMV